MTAELIFPRLRAGDLLGIPTLLLHIAGHIRSIRKVLGKPDEIDTKSEFVSFSGELVHFVKDVAELIPGEWDDTAAQKIESLLLSDNGSELAWRFWQWYQGLPTPPSVGDVGAWLQSTANEMAA